MKPPVAILAALASLCLGLASCASATWQHEHRFQRPPPGSIGSLEPEVDGLGECLERLGAPLFVYETPGGFAVAYGWFESKDLAGSISLPVTNTTSASYTLRDIDGRMKGLVLFFGPQAELLLIRRGPLRDLLAEPRRIRPHFEQP